MAIEQLHGQLSSAAAAWLLEISNPLRSSASCSVPRGEVVTALFAAELHGVLPQAVRALRSAAARDPLALGNEDAAAVSSAGVKLIHQTGIELLLRHHTQSLLDRFRAAGVAGAIVKGPVFARRLYPEPALRTFTDIDLLIDSADRDKASAVMRSQGFELHEQDYREGQDYFEDKWVLASNDRIMIEVHSDLVHNPRLRQAASLALRDVLEAGAGDAEDATAILLIATTHAAISHQFDRLQHLADIALAAAGAAGEISLERLATVATRCGLKTAVHAALALTARAFGDARIGRLAEALSPSPFDRAAARLLSAKAVLAARSDSRSEMSWRRKALRQAIRYGARG